MRLARVTANGQSFYHCISRVVEGRFIFGTSEGGSVEAEYFLALMRRLEVFCGIRVLNYVLMSNHFHLLCEVPEPRPLSQSEVLERIEALYGPLRVQALQEQLARYAEQPDGLQQCNRLLEPYRKRMDNLSIFFKELKGRFAQWFNRRRRRYGVLWAERFKSLLLESGRAVATVAAYIDLNPVRPCVQTPRSIDTVDMPRRWPRDPLLPVRRSEPFWVYPKPPLGRNCLPSIASICS